MSVVVADTAASGTATCSASPTSAGSSSGGIVGLLGPNGAGKSTLIKMMAGLLRPSRGSLTVFGASPFDDVEVRRRIGYAPEHEKTWDELTALELVDRDGASSPACRGNARKAAAEAALAQMGMTDAMHRRVKGFSKGMRQRTKLATAIAHDPDFLLLDEPLTGVDPMARIDIVEQIQQARRGRQDDRDLEPRALRDRGADVARSSSSIAARCSPRATSTRSAS